MCYLFVALLYALTIVADLICWYLYRSISHGLDFIDFSALYVSLDVNLSSSLVLNVLLIYVNLL